MKSYLHSPISLGRSQHRIEKQLEKSLANLQAEPENYQFHIDVGDAQCLLENVEEGIREYYEAIDLLRRSPKFEKVRKDIVRLYGRIITNVPDEERAYIELSEEYVASGQREKAYRFLLSSARKATDNSSYILALKCYNQVIAMGKINPHILERCSELYLKLGKKKEAIENYIQAGDLFAHEEKFLEALDYYKKANAIGQDAPELLLKIARLYSVMGWAENAASEFVKIANYYEKLTNYPEALKYYQTSLELDAENEKAQQGKARVEELNVIESPWTPSEASDEEQEGDVLNHLDHIEVAQIPDNVNGPAQSGSDEPEDALVDLDALDALEQVPLSDTSRKKTPSTTEVADSQLPPGTSAERHKEEAANAPNVNLEECLINLNEEELSIQEGLEAHEESSCSSEPPDTRHDSLEFLLSLDSERESEQDDMTSQQANTEIEFIPEDSLQELGGQESHSFPAGEPDTGKQMDEAKKPTPCAPEYDMTAQQGHIEKLQQKIERLEQQLEETEQAKRSLEARFAERMERLKTQEGSMQHEYEELFKEKEELERRLQDIIMAYKTSRENSDRFDDARYEALVSKIQGKKQMIQHHLNTLLKKREENGRFLTEELKNLSETKRRLQENVSCIQQVKAQIEERVETELKQAQEKIQSLHASSQDLQQKLQQQQQLEQELRQEFDTLHREKEALQDEYTETISALTAENAELEERLHAVATAKQRAEQELKQRLNELEHSYQDLKNEYTESLQSKEQKLNATAQRLNEFVEKYVKLEQTLADIRKERDGLNRMLAEETATREMLEERLVGIESQVDSLEIQGTELLTQLGLELDRQFNMERDISDEFQLSLEELEGLLALQEKEIRSLEVV